MMYYYWVHGRIRPSFFYNLPLGELKIIQAFYELEIESIPKVGGGET
jgi:hypothetical protein